MREIASYVDGVPNFVSLPILALLVGSFLIAVVRRGGESNERQESEGGASVTTRVGAAGEIQGA